MELLSGVRVTAVREHRPIRKHKRHRLRRRSEDNICGQKIFHNEVAKRRAKFRREDDGTAQRTELLSKTGKCTDFHLKPNSKLIEELRQRFDPTGEGSQTTPHLYSDKALLQRESLRFDPLICATLNELWRMVDKDHNGKMDMPEYREFHCKLALVLLPGKSKEEIDRLFEIDWARDTLGGTRPLNKATFSESMFELADRWTDEISAPDYINFLQGTFQALSEKDSLGRRVYKTEEKLLERGTSIPALSSMHAQKLAEAREKAASENRDMARLYQLTRELSRRKSLCDGDGLLNPASRVRSEYESKECEAKQDNEPGDDDYSNTEGSDDDELARRHTLGALSSLNSKSLEKETSSRQFYPPPASWWARHARPKKEVEHTVQSTGGEKLISESGCQRKEQNIYSKSFGVVLFDPREPIKIHHLIVAVGTSQIEQYETLELEFALEKLTETTCKGASHLYKAGTLKKNDGFETIVSATDWRQFCTNADIASVRVNSFSPTEMTFVGFSSSFDKDTKSVMSTLHFSQEDVANLISSVTKRPSLGLSCPIMQAKIAKYINQKLGNGLVDAEAMSHSQGVLLKNTPNTKSIPSLKFQNESRSHACRLLLQNVCRDNDKSNSRRRGSRPKTLKPITRRRSVDLTSNHVFTAQPQRTSFLPAQPIEMSLETAVRRMSLPSNECLSENESDTPGKQSPEEFAEMFKRHTVSVLTLKTEMEKHQALVQSGRVRLANLLKKPKPTRILSRATSFGNRRSLSSLGNRRSLSSLG